MPLEQQVAQEQGVTVVALAGQLDSRTAPELEKSLLQLVAKGERELLIDLAALDYVASAGLRIFVMVGKRLAAEGGRLALCAVNASVLKVLEVSGFVSLFPLLPNRREAIPWLLANARAARVSSLAGELLRKDGGAPAPRPAAGADREKSAYAAELLKRKPPG